MLGSAGSVFIRRGLGPRMRASSVNSIRKGVPFRPRGPPDKAHTRRPEQVHVVSIDMGDANARGRTREEEPPLPAEAVAALIRKLRKHSVLSSSDERIL